MTRSESRVASGGEPLSAPYTLVLTHDVDNLSMRSLPFLGRAQLSILKALVFGNLRRLVRGRLAGGDYLASLAMAMRLPLVALGLARDPWEQSIELITDIEEEFGVRSTFFFMPFDRQAGQVRPGQPAPESRASSYRLSDCCELIQSLMERGWEVGVHGIDCHVSAEAAAAERAELTSVVGSGRPIGVRMHWLYSSPELRRNLAQAGYAYDASCGSNDTIGFPRAKEEPGRVTFPDGDRARQPGSSPAYRPFVDEDTGLPVLPLNIQDVALLRADHMDLTPEEAWSAVAALLDTARQNRAVVTILWHNDSFLPPRCWEGLYRRILERVRADGAEIARAIDATLLAAPPVAAT